MIVFYCTQRISTVFSGGARQGGVWYKNLLILKDNLVSPSFYNFFYRYKEIYEGRRYIHTLYYQYMKKYPWDMQYFMGFRGQSLDVIKGHDK